jgi:hypothetical protein
MWTLLRCTTVVYCFVGLLAAVPASSTYHRYCVSPFILLVLAYTDQLRTQLRIASDSRL